MNQQEIIWAKIPFSNFEEIKIRPAIIISNNKYNNESHDLLICALTSNLDQKGILVDKKNLSSGNLPTASVIRADKILLINKELVNGAFARINDDTFDQLISKINELISR